MFFCEKFFRFFVNMSTTPQAVFFPKKPPPAGKKEVRKNRSSAPPVPIFCLSVKLHRPAQGQMIPIQQEQVNQLTAARKVCGQQPVPAPDQLVCGRDVVIVARVRAANSTYQQLEKSFLYLAGKLELLKKEQDKV